MQGDYRAVGTDRHIGTQNSFIVKRKGLGKNAVFSRDPLNLKNIHSKKVCCSRTTTTIKNISNAKQFAGFAQDKVH